MGITGLFLCRNKALNLIEGQPISLNIWDRKKNNKIKSVTKFLI